MIAKKGGRRFARMAAGHHGGEVADLS